MRIIVLCVFVFVELRRRCLLITNPSKAEAAASQRRGSVNLSKQLDVFRSLSLGKASETLSSSETNENKSPSAQTSGRVAAS
ncbi:hypothetical protein BDR26DRAFT_852646 [Obelidium mucronatum]|nr:hypothetical protein BDR26DRAFT_852646 [Obelidium mucronatum]